MAIRQARSNKHNALSKQRAVKNKLLIQAVLSGGTTAMPPHLPPPSPPQRGIAGNKRQTACSPLPGSSLPSPTIDRLKRPRRATSAKDTPLDDANHATPDTAGPTSDMRQHVDSLDAAGGQPRQVDSENSNNSDGDFSDEDPTTTDDGQSDDGADGEEQGRASSPARRQAMNGDRSVERPPEPIEPDTEAAIVTPNPDLIKLIRALSAIKGDKDVELDHIAVAVREVAGAAIEELETRLGSVKLAIIRGEDTEATQVTDVDLRCYAEVVHLTNVLDLLPTEADVAHPPSLEHKRSVKLAFLTLKANLLKPARANTAVKLMAKGDTATLERDYSAPERRVVALSLLVHLSTSAPFATSPLQRRAHPHQATLCFTPPH